MNHTQQLKALSKVEQKVLEMWIEHGNAFAKSSDSDPWILTTDQFFSDHWQETFHVNKVSTGWHDVWTMSAGTGDDGGPAILTIWATAPDYPGYNEDSPHIAAIAFDFDTMITMMWNYEQGGWVSWPDDIPKPEEAA